jgi:hypothetical protein
MNGYQIFTQPSQQALDTAANVLSGATLTFSLTGTSTPTDAFSDPTLTTPVANPLSANAAGVWIPIFLDPTVTYRIVLKTAAGAVLQTWDPANELPLGRPIPIAAGGTGADTVPEALENLGLIYLSTEITVNADITLGDESLGKAHLLEDSGSPVNFTVQLPADAATGSLILLRVSSTATKLYTIHGNDQDIDGQATRVMWRGESCLLLREADKWTKIEGRTIPFRGCLVRTSSQSFADGATWVKVTLNDEVGDPYGLDLCFDAANNRFQAPRRSSYHIGYNISITATVATAAAIADAALSATGAGTPTNRPNTFQRLPYPVDGERVTMTSAGVFSLDITDYVELLVRIQDAASAGTAAITGETVEVASLLEPTVSYHEVPLW